LGALKGRTVDVYLNGSLLGSAGRWQNKMALRLELAAYGAWIEKITL
jgi:hypothetical protein